MKSFLLRLPPLRGGGILGTLADFTGDGSGEFEFPSLRFEAFRAWNQKLRPEIARDFGNGEACFVSMTPQVHRIAWGLGDAVSIHVASIVWRTELGGPSVKAVAMKLADCADDDGTNVFPGRRKLARETETSERTVDNAIAELVTLGVLVLVEKGGKGPGHTNAYRFDLDVLWKLHAETLRKWKEEDDKVKGANSAPLRRTKRRDASNKHETKEENEGAEFEGCKVAKYATIDDKVANPADKPAKSAKKVAAAAPNPSLTHQLDSSLNARAARGSEFNFDFGSEGSVEADTPAPGPQEVAVTRNTASWDRWLSYLEQADRPTADRMRKAFVVFAATRDPLPNSPPPRIPDAAIRGKNHKGKAA